MRWPRKSIFGALVIGAFFGQPDPVIMLKIAFIVMLSMAITVLPLLFFSQRTSFHLHDNWLGPYCEIFDGPPNLKHFIYLSGPLLTFAFGLYTTYFWTFFYPYNIIPFIWGLLRFLPTEPFEGWLVLRGVLRPILGFWERRASYLIAGIFLTATTLVALLNVHSDLYWIGIATIALSFYNFQNFWHYRRGGPADEDPKLLALYQEAINLFRQNKGKEADNCLWQLIQSPLEGVIIDQARVIYAKGLVEQAEPQKALDILTPCLKRSPSGIFNVLHRIAYQCDQFDMVRELAQKAWSEEKESSVAIINAIASARLYGNNPKKKFLEEVIGWLNAAARIGYHPWDVLESPDFDGVKNEPLFKSFKQQLASYKRKVASK